MARVMSLQARLAEAERLLREARAVLPEHPLDGKHHDRAADRAARHIDASLGRRR